jgi:hypothetical protein
MENPTPSQRTHFGRGIIQQDLESKKGKVEVSWEKAKKTLQFRHYTGIEDLKIACDDECEAISNASLVLPYPSDEDG